MSSITEELVTMNGGKAQLTKVSGISKTGGGQGGSMNAVGYAYVGKKNPVSPNESNEDKTVVQLLDVVDD